ncbi:DUF1573 domain-containing protein, partial [bacterium]|nr:DUF1573 domain-containing protein [bacterium]
FKNTGGQPLVIQDVRPSCSCTAPDWTKKPIRPGESGYVTAEFDPKNRPGNFNKSLTIRSNATVPNELLRIIGKVTPKEKTLEDIYPKAMGPIRLKASHLSIGNISPAVKKTEQLEIINSSDSPITIVFERVPKHITVKSLPATLKPGQAGVILASYNAALKNDWGYSSDAIYMKFGDKLDYKNRLSVSANVQEDFNTWTAEQKQNAAKAEFDNKVFNFNEITQGEKAEHNFVLTNKGKSTLIIRKVKASCGCTAINPQKKEIAPGESTSIKAVFNSAGKSGRQNKSITVITNDPLASSVLLRVQGTVIAAKK